jgi:hypothetical protein
VTAPSYPTTCGTTAATEYLVDDRRFTPGAVRRDRARLNLAESLRRTAEIIVRSFTSPHVHALAPSIGHKAKPNL